MGAARGGGAALGSGAGQAGVKASGADVLSPGCAQHLVGLRHFMPIDRSDLSWPPSPQKKQLRKEATNSIPLPGMLPAQECFLWLSGAGRSAGGRGEACSACEALQPATTAQPSP